MTEKWNEISHWFGHEDLIIRFVWTSKMVVIASSSLIMPCCRNRYFDTEVESCVDEVGLRAGFLSFAGFQYFAMLGSIPNGAGTKVLWSCSYSLL